ncbi:hypothetical protein QR77_15810 [Streptomyces sp. 150FB]|uniref:hypothetical protein n=1 Tax=Streptomyces sp. 150FB TaxID=1576605 RepID=UPI0005896312|nr:hypothetical protein [Streptomyces sp. 150FB]KIF75013.1 hypothetical protein QR77_15810 [Streptomyces sp. 150FB]
MHANFSSAELALSAEPVFSFRPLHVAQLSRGWAVDVRASDLAPLAASADAARHLGAGRGYLHDSEQNHGLARMLRERPEDFGAASHIVLGADEVELFTEPGTFADLVHIIGPECIDGMQRLKVIAHVAGELSREHLDRSVVRLEIVCGPERERARRVYDVAERYVNASTAQDKLIRCRHIVRLMDCDWEGDGFFCPRRGMATGPGGPLFSMADVTRALACLSVAPRPYAAHLASTEEGLDALWSDFSSPHYKGLFHGTMAPVGVMRALEAWRAARDALSAMPKRCSERHGHLIAYAPELICWAACRKLFPLAELHDQRSGYAWDQVIRHQLPGETVRMAERLVEYYRLGRPKDGKGDRSYKAKAPELELWLELLDMAGV